MSNLIPDSVSQPQRLAILQHGGFSSRYGKTGQSLIRYRGAEVVAVIDREFAGQSLRAVSRLSQAPDIPIVGTLAEALAAQPTVLAIGISPSGGIVREEWWPELRAAIQAGVSLWNGCHTQLLSDPAIAAAVRPGVYVWDMRREPAGLKPGTGAAAQLPSKRVLFIGTDMNIGKMTAALEFDRDTRARGIRSAFVGTGQTGMMIAGNGMCLDAVRVDYASGAVEQEVVKAAAHADVVWVEGQGSMLNPSSTATLPLMRGTQPTHLIVVAKANLDHLQALPHIKLPPLKDVVTFYEQVSAAGGTFPRVPVVGIALNTWGLDETAARAAVAKAARDTGLPATDAVRFGTKDLLDAIVGPQP